jgi:chromatin assembly factor 1 subunit B
VQGVSWDPRNKYILTQSSDKSVRFYKNTNSKLEMKFIYINQLKRFEIKNNSNKNNANINNNINNNTENINKTNTNENIQPQQQDNISNSNNENKMSIEDEQNKNNTNNQNNNNNQQLPNQIKKEKESNQKNVVTYHYYFADEDQCNTFVRRSSFSPDGKICLLVSGVMQNPQNKNELNFVVWGVSRKDFSRPQFYIPTLNKSSTCVRFCPLIFHKKENDADNSTPALLDLNYVMIFAIGTNDSVFIYGTDSIQPRYAITNIHYQSITDLAWNGDKMLAVSSSDGYISFIIFEENELGVPYKPQDINWDDEKFKKQYQLYFDVDINKNVMSNTQNIITDIKIKKKKNNNPTTNTNNNNNLNENKTEEENRINNNEKNNEENIEQEKMEVENQLNN